MKKLRALFLNGSLKPPDEDSNTDHLVSIVQKELLIVDPGISIEFVRLSGSGISFGKSHDEGDGDGWPAVEKKILEADIVVFASPIWWGQKSSLIQQVIERLDAINDDVKAGADNPLLGKIAAVIVTGAEDGAQAIFKDLTGTLNWMGFTIPPEAGVYWVGEVGKPVDAREAMDSNKVVLDGARMLAENCILFSRMIIEKGVDKMKGNIKNADAHAEGVEEIKRHLEGILHEVNEMEGSRENATTLDWDALAREYEKIDTMPDSKIQQFLSIIHAADDNTIRQLVSKNIKFVTKIAVNEFNRRGLKNDCEDEKKNSIVWRADRLSKGSSLYGSERKAKVENGVVNSLPMEQPHSTSSTANALQGDNKSSMDMMQHLVMTYGPEIAKECRMDNAPQAAVDAISEIASITGLSNDDIIDDYILGGPVTEMQPANGGGEIGKKVAAAFKDATDVGEPWAVANWMKGKGYS